MGNAAMNAKQIAKRKWLNFSIKRDMQFRMIGRIFLLLFVSLLLSSLIFYLFANREVTSSYQQFHIKAGNFLDFLWPVVLGSFFISLVVGWLGSLFFPKPIAGGIFRIEQDLGKVLEKGDLTLRIKLRQGDQVQPLAAAVNELLDDYRDRIGRLDRSLEAIEAFFAGETAGEGNENRRKARQACAALRGELRQLDY